MSGDYYKDLIDPMRGSTADSISEEEKRIERIEKGRAQETAMAMVNSPIFVELQKQTQLNGITILQQERQIEELKSQNEKLQNQLEMLKKADMASKKQAKRSFIGFIITTVIALASLAVAIIALAR